MKKIILILIVGILVSIPILGAPMHQQNTYNYFEKHYIGELTRHSSQVILENQAYQLYSLDETLYIPLSYLGGVAGSIEKKEYTTQVLPGKEVGIPDKWQGESYKAYLNDEIVYIGNLKTYSLKVENEIFIPLEALTIDWELSEWIGNYKLSRKRYNLNQYIKIEEGQIINSSPYILRISYTELFWNGKDYNEICYEDILIEPNQSIETSKKQGIIHLTTYLRGIYGLENDIKQENPYGQKNTKLYQNYQKILRLEELEKVFTPYKIQAKIKYDIGHLKAKDEVEVWRGEKNAYYVVIDASHKQVNVPWQSISIQGNSGGKGEARQEEIEDYINLKQMESPTPYFVWTDLSRQRTYIFTGEKEKWHLEKTFICSTGRDTFPTPKGVFKMEYRMPYFGMGKGFMCKHATVIFRDYMYHSILFDKTGHYVKEGNYQLGQRVSHGCIRLSEKDSKWIYSNVPLETTVWIN